MAGKNRKKTHKIMKSCGILVAFVLVIGITVAITWALLTAQTKQKSNVFTGAEGLKVQLDETGWDGYTGEKPPADTDDKTLGINMAKNYSPSQEIPKDPKITNTSAIKEGYEDDSKEYVALRLTYQIARNDGTDDSPNLHWETVSYEKFQQLADVYVSGGATAGFNVAKDSDSDTEKANKWHVKTATGLDENTIFYYGSALEGTKNGQSTQNVTTTLFDYVKIDENLTTETILSCENDAEHKVAKSEKHKGLIQFRIVVEGFAVQAYENGEDITLATAKTRLDTLMQEHIAERPQDNAAITQP